MFVIKDLIDRYGTSEASIYEKMRELDLAGVNHQLTFSQEAVETLDKAFGYEEEIPEPSDDARKIDDLTRRNEILGNQIDELKTALQQEKAATIDYQKELDELQQKFHSFQEGHEGMNSTLIKKYKSSAEHYQKQYNDMLLQYNNLSLQNNNRFTEYENRISDYEERLKQINELQKMLLMYESKLFSYESKESKLQSEISHKDSEINSLTVNMNKAEESRIQAIQQAEYLKNYITETVDRMDAVINSLRSRVASEVVIDNSASVLVHVNQPEQIQQNNINRINWDALPDEDKETLAVQDIPDKQYQEDGHTIDNVQPEQKSDINPASNTAPSDSLLYSDDEPLDFNRTDEEPKGALSSIKKKFSGFFSMF